MDRRPHDNAAEPPTAPHDPRTGLPFRGIPDRARRKADPVRTFYARGVQPPTVARELLQRRARIAQARAEAQQRRAATVTETDEPAPTD